MQPFSTSYFKDPITDHQFIEQWVSKLEQLNDKHYKRNNVTTSLGVTVVWSNRSKAKGKPALFIFPGFRTTSLFWDLDNNLQPIEDHYHIYLVETNGQPTLSDGNTPDIKTLDYGYWAAEVITHFTHEKVDVAGASFGALICLKLVISVPDQIKNIFLLNPGCLQPFSLSIKNLFYNLLPIFKPSQRNVKQFLDKAVLYPPVHNLDDARMQLLIDYQVFALTRHVDKAQKPYPMDSLELAYVQAPIHLIVGENDLLFPYKRSVKAATESLKSLKSVTILPEAGHGIETYKNTMNVIKDILVKNAQQI